ncbi:MAG: crossover junction endodeoxyribonuclease RuvC [Planctomycetota bacterium]
MVTNRVLGIDPGSQVVGWAVAEVGASGQLARVDSGIWKLGRSPVDIGKRLACFHAHLSEAVHRFQPDLVALEAAFFGKNARSALRLGESRGVVLMTAESMGVPLVEFPPATVKARVAGAGAANKDQVDKMVRMFFAEPELAPASADETDALAVAACALLGPAFRDATSLKTAETGESRPQKRGKLPPGATFQ